MSEPPEIPEHRVIRQIGGGAYGEVWLALNSLGEGRAVKIVRRARFNGPAPFARELAGVRHFEPISRQHDGLVDILQFGQREEAGFFYYIMELADPCVPGAGDGEYTPRTLSAALRESGALPAAEAARIFVALADALVFLHAHELVHRDLKPSNVIFVAGVPKLADIGAVTSDDSRSSLVGTAGYLPPEGAGTPGADMFALGRMLYEAATGEDRQRFPLLPPERLAAIDAPQLLDLNTIWLRACAERTSERYPSASALLADLRAVLAGESIRHRGKMTRRIVLGTLATAAGGFLLYRKLTSLPTLPGVPIAAFHRDSGPLNLNAETRPWDKTSPGVARLGDDGLFLDGGDTPGPAMAGVKLPLTDLGPRAGWHLLAEVRVEPGNLADILLARIFSTECDRLFALPLTGLKEGRFHNVICPLTWDDPLSITAHPSDRMLPFDAARLVSPVHLDAVAFGLPTSDKHIEKHPRLAVTIRRLAIVPPGTADTPPVNAALGWSCYNAPRHILPTRDRSPIPIADLSLPNRARTGGVMEKATFTPSADGLRIAASSGHGWLDVNLQTLDLTAVSDHRVRTRLTIHPSNEQTELRLHLDDPEFDNRVFAFQFAAHPAGKEIAITADRTIGDPTDTRRRNGQAIPSDRVATEFNLRRIRKISLGAVHDSSGPLDITIHAIEIIP